MALSKHLHCNCADRTPTRGTVLRRAFSRHPSVDCSSEAALQNCHDAQHVPHHVLDAPVLMLEGLRMVFMDENELLITIQGRRELLEGIRHPFLFWIYALGHNLACTEEGHFNPTSLFSKPDDEHYRFRSGALRHGADTALLTAGSTGVS